MCDAVTPEATMTDLRLVAVTPERSHLVLEDSDSRQFRVPVDERLAAALRTPERSRPGQVEIALESQLSPREIQARVRAGHSVDEVAVAAGVSTDRVERYAAPVLAERAHVVEQAQKAPARRATAGSAPALAELVDARLAEQKVAADSVTWDAWRGDDDRWTVRLGYLGTGRAREATWTFDPRGRVLAPADDEARWLVDGSGADRVDEDAPAAVRRLAAVPRRGRRAERAPVSPPTRSTTARRTRPARRCPRRHRCLLSRSSRPGTRPRPPGDAASRCRPGTTSCSARASATEPLGSGGDRRDGSVTHSDHDPAYSAASMPATARASTVCAAATPDPQ